MRQTSYLALLALPFLSGALPAQTRMVQVAPGAGIPAFEYIRRSSIGRTSFLAGVVGDQIHVSVDDGASWHRFIDAPSVRGNLFAWANNGLAWFEYRVGLWVFEPRQNAWSFLSIPDAIPNATRTDFLAIAGETNSALGASFSVIGSSSTRFGAETSRYLEAAGAWQPVGVVTNSGPFRVSPKFLDDRGTVGRAYAGGEVRYVAGPGVATRWSSCIGVGVAQDVVKLSAQSSFVLTDQGFFQCLDPRPIQPLNLPPFDRALVITTDVAGNEREYGRWMLYRNGASVGVYDLVPDNGSFGVGCGGVEIRPIMGTVFWDVTLPQGATGALMLVGVNRRTFNGLSLPFALDVIGAPGCSLYISADITDPIRISNGVGSYIASRPAMPLAPIYYQALALAPINRLGVALSAALETIE